MEVYHAPVPTADQSRLSPVSRYGGDRGQRHAEKHSMATKSNTSVSALKWGKIRGGMRADSLKNPGDISPDL
jgi:hypothetical protein